MACPDVNRVNLRNPLSRVWGELCKAASIRASGVWIPGALLMDLPSKQRNRRFRPPHNTGVLSEVVLIPEGPDFKLRPPS